LIFFHCRWLQPTALLIEEKGFSQILSSDFGLKPRAFSVIIPLAEANGNDFTCIINFTIIF
jgi:hypothetical protein